MQLSMIPNRSLLVAHLSGELDHHITGELREAIDRELMRRGVRNLAFDLTQMSFMDSSGLGLIMGRFKKVSAIGGRLIVYGMNGNIKRIFNMCGMEKLVIVADSLNEGMEELDK
ncbi:MAG TPA: anti-sigma factor antagonist [Candidatus Ornithomonoglobus intestinigallinarum]|uniref:Anti-sigma factor antagonist n=1 Tax=Candidatus Ornithomonoglobus intestinigallinarum TaxID=2840894 RepID=A0A9D1H212_9FIRM|nr:anti-sigma factor antagonist [Candidatus Ornithomonoglobus intestinigallinarum]